MYDEIKNFVSSLKHINDTCEPEIGLLCLVKMEDGYFRAQIAEVFCNDGIYVRVFLCDSGLFYDRPIEDCINIPKFLIDFVPFQVR